MSETSSHKGSTQELMGSAKYTQLDHGGLEVVEQHNAPEVVPSRPYTSVALNRKSSFFHPEPYHAPPYVYGDKQEHGNYYGGAQGGLPEYEMRPQYINPDVKEAGATTHETTGRDGERRIWGMRKKLFIILLSVAALVIVLAVVLGAVLATVLPEDK